MSVRVLGSQGVQERLRGIVLSIQDTLALECLECICPARQFSKIFIRNGLHYKRQDRENNYFANREFR